MVRIISNNDNNNEIENSDGDANPSYDEDETKSGNVKKGPWTPLEDMILTEYVKKHGEGNWNSVQKNSGLLRCGKSCRLRWANHLRPNLKKGAFSDDEEKIIIELHAKLGNKWARMAAQLPGRTDNEIKNFWNTRLKRRQRQGLPIYPPEVVDAEATAYNNRLKQQHFKQPFSSTSLQFSLLLNSCYPKKSNEPTHNSATNPIQNQQNSSASANHSTNPLSQFKLFNENRRNETLAIPLSPISPISPISSISHYPSSSSTLLNQNFSAHNSAPNDTHDYQYSGSLSYDHGFIEGTVYEPLPLVPDSTTEISSSQTAHDSATPASSYASAVDGLMGSSTSSLVKNDYYEVAPLSSSSPEGNSGLLDALVKEGNTLSRNDNGKVSYKRKNMEADELVEEEGTFPMMEPAMKKNSGDTTNEVSKGKKQVVEDPFALGEMNSMDDDLFSLLNNFPSEMPTPEWYRRGKTQSLGLENETEASSSSGPTDQEFAWTLGTCWNNMPGIC